MCMLSATAVLSINSLTIQTFMPGMSSETLCSSLRTTRLKFTFLGVPIPNRRLLMSVNTLESFKLKESSLIPTSSSWIN